MQRNQLLNKINTTAEMLDLYNKFKSEPNRIFDKFKRKPSIIRTFKTGNLKEYSLFDEIYKKCNSAYFNKDNGQNIINSIEHLLAVNGLNSKDFKLNIEINNRSDCPEESKQNNPNHLERIFYYGCQVIKLDIESELNDLMRFCLYLNFTYDQDKNKIDNQERQINNLKKEREILKEELRQYQLRDMVGTNTTALIEIKKYAHDQIMKVIDFQN